MIQHQKKKKNLHCIVAIIRNSYNGYFNMFKKTSTLTQTYIFSVWYGNESNSVGFSKTEVQSLIRARNLKTKNFINAFLDVLYMPLA